MISAVACGLGPSPYLLTFGLNDTVCQVAGPFFPGFPPSLVSSLYTLSALRVSVVLPIHWTPSARRLVLSWHSLSLRCSMHLSARPCLVGVNC